VEPGPPIFFLSLARHFHFAVRMTALRIIFMGAADLSSAGLEALAHDAKFQIAAVVTHPDHPKGRGLKPQPSPVKSLALKLKLPVLQPECARDEKFIAELRALRPDLIIVVAYGHILPPAILDLPRFGCLNVHTSLLPKYRGAAPIQWAIANGETETGVTIMKMDEGLDTGGILAQRHTFIRPADDSVTLNDRLARLGAGLLAQTIPDYVAGKIQPAPQPAEGASHAPKIKKEDGRIDWNQPAQTILNRLRAFMPWPGAFTFLPNPPSVGRASPRAGSFETVHSDRLASSLAPPDETGSTQPKPRLIKIWKAEVIEQSGESIHGRDGTSAGRPGPAGPKGFAEAGEAPLPQKPGEILQADKTGIVVGCGERALRILELQRESGRRMSAAEFLAGHALKVGEKFEG
jgi:methionyl-tRNA formyltransferase